MKTSRALNFSGGLLIVVASTYAWPQPSGTNATSSSAAIAASTAPAKADRKANRALRRKVYAAIVKHSEINAGNISVIARGGAVSIDGAVADASQIDKVIEIAKGVPGGTTVTNKLTVKKPFGGL